MQETDAILKNNKSIYNHFMMKVMKNRIEESCYDDLEDDDYVLVSTLTLQSKLMSPSSSILLVQHSSWFPVNDSA